MKNSAFTIVLLTIINFTKLHGCESNQLSLVSVQPHVDDAPPSYEEATLATGNYLENSVRPLELSNWPVCRTVESLSLSYRLQEANVTENQLITSSSTDSNDLSEEVIPRAPQNYESLGIYLESSEDLSLERENIEASRNRLSMIRTRMERENRQKQCIALICVFACCPCFMLCESLHALSKILRID